MTLKNDWSRARLAPGTPCQLGTVRSGLWIDNESFVFVDTHQGTTTLVPTDRTIKLLFEHGPYPFQFQDGGRNYVVAKRAPKSLAYNRRLT